MTSDLDHQISKLLFEMLQTDEDLIRLGRLLAPMVNQELAKQPVRKAVKTSPKPTDYCPGCGELSDSAPDLCDDCLSVNAED